MINIGNIGEYFQVFSLIIGSIGTAVVWVIFQKFRKRTEEINVAGTEHDAVKRISQNTIETIERLNDFSEQLSNKVLLQREEFSNTVSKLEDELKKLKTLNKDYEEQLFDLKEHIDALLIENAELKKQLLNK